VRHAVGDRSATRLSFESGLAPLVELIVFVGGVSRVVGALGTARVARAPEVARGAHLGVTTVARDRRRRPDATDGVVGLGRADSGTEVVGAHVLGRTQDLRGAASAVGPAEESRTSCRG